MVVTKANGTFKAFPKGKTLNYTVGTGVPDGPLIKRRTENGKKNSNNPRKLRPYDTRSSFVYNQSIRDV